MKITDIETYLVSAAHPGSGTEGVTSRHWDRCASPVQKAVPGVRCRCRCRLASRTRARRSRNWLFVKVFTDEGIYGVGESSGWPKVVETAIHDLKPLLIGEGAIFD